MTRERTALLLIDAQVNMFDPANPVISADPLLARLKGLVAQSRASQAPIFFVRNCGGAGDPDVRGTPGWELHPALDAELKQRGVTRLLVAGLQSEYCVRETALGGLARGFDVTLVSDGHGTHDGRDQSATEKSAAVNTELEGRVRLVRAADVRFD